MVKDMPAPVSRIVNDFANANFMKKEWRRIKNPYHGGKRFIFSQVVVDNFVNKAPDGSWFAFPINVLEMLLLELNAHAISRDDIAFETLPVPQGKKITIHMRPDLKPRPNQEKALEFLMTRPPEGPRNKLLGLNTGEGKSFCSMVKAADLGERVMLITSPKYMEKWIIETKDKCQMNDDDIIQVTGRQGIIGIMNIANRGKLHAKVIAISVDTLRLYLRDYEQFSDQFNEIGYLTDPLHFFEYLGVGLLWIDEAHENLGFYVKMFSYTNVRESISMTGSLISRDSFILKIQGFLYPESERYISTTYVKTVIPVALFYSIDPKWKIKWKGPMGYNHMLYESGILKDPNLKKRYAALIYKAVKEFFTADPDYQPGDKAIVYCATKKMCSYITFILSTAFPDLNVKRFITGDPYQENLIDPDIRVATLKKAGTAQDISGLTRVILTIATDSPIANIQSMGRLRPLPDGRFTKYIFFTCQNIEQHNVYYRSKIKDIKERTLSLQSVTYPML